jgi:formylglycine-generating enzyme required for sulfatase activity
MCFYRLPLIGNYTNSFLFILPLAFSVASYANNVVVDQIDVVDGAVPEQSTISMRLSWDNSWRLTTGPANYDAIWLFAKFRTNAGPWQHVKLEGGVPIPAGATIDLYDGGIGAMIYRNSPGMGAMVMNNLKFTWDHGAVGIPSVKDILDLRVFALEMVFVPEGGFYLGTGTAVSGGVDEDFEFKTGGENGNALFIDSSDPLTFGNAAGELYYRDFGFSFDSPPPPVLPADFPKGYRGFYCMKYETSQQQWVDFFNTLTPDQKLARDVTDSDGKRSDAVVNRNAVSWTDPMVMATTSLPFVPMNFVSADDMLAYFDWAGLRPMTEMEYEKASRGSLNPVNGEYAWGTAAIHDERYEIEGAGSELELITNPSSIRGNAVYDLTTPTDASLQGPLRCGIFAASSPVAERIPTGASYYGIMELCGNLYEGTIDPAAGGGATFTNQHGDGQLTADGQANVPTWPVGGAGTGLRGGRYGHQVGYLPTSERRWMLAGLRGRSNLHQMRGVRGR